MERDDSTTLISQVGMDIETDVFAAWIGTDEV